MRMQLKIGLTVVAGLLCGCGGGSEQLTVAPVSGKVLCNGEPVTEGLVLFSPVNSAEVKNKPGKAGSGDIQPDGTFVITTYASGDGAVIGKVKITAGASDPDHPWKCNLSTPIEFEVKPGKNQVTIELLPDGTGKVGGGG